MSHLNALLLLIEPFTKLLIHLSFLLKLVAKFQDNIHLLLT